jgi:hypothetical protein
MSIIGCWHVNFLPCLVKNISLPGAKSQENRCPILSVEGGGPPTPRLGLLRLGLAGTRPSIILIFIILL